MRYFQQYRRFLFVGLVFCLFWCLPAAVLAAENKQLEIQCVTPKIEGTQVIIPYSISGYSPKERIFIRTSWQRQGSAYTYQSFQNFKEDPADDGNVNTNNSFNARYSGNRASLEVKNTAMGPYPVVYNYKFEAFKKWRNKKEPEVLCSCSGSIRLG